MGPKRPDARTSSTYSKLEARQSPFSTQFQAEYLRQHLLKRSHADVLSDRHVGEGRRRVLEGVVQVAPGLELEICHAGAEVGLCL
ncbi:hypothetical protein HBI56_007480 [Parastagonospora nodorum]|nr:hypothetical protein HBH53_076170 [Parastagonospora nodorum]KAH3986877.1 hypothetical protein HBH51_009260 [Parastagonospora nodorum]KAH4033234.1 hypothetical protein HBI13_007910 [Parastagonospora nodorum]KAH4042039.1 hypothetical protein HBI09_007850 [Parastagonospora nodorum]KAH4099496.1 hypothetical protein HBH48_007950 [Parastagonospora nodorum]